MFFLSINIKSIKKAIVIAGLSAAALLPSMSKIPESKEAMMPVENRTVVIDAGHGGFDPGKEGSSGEDEQYINLKIASYLQQYLEQSGASVIITRNDDSALGDTKKSDMSERRNIIEDSDADITVSIHQNSFPSKNVHGAQVFYYKDSEEGKKLAEYVQDALIETLDNSNTRTAKANSDYYMLRTNSTPSIIVECGFLSNPSEEASLNSPDYQQKTAWAIYKGIIDYFHAE